MQRLFFTILIVSATSCIHPPVVETQSIPVFSKPQGAEVTVNGKVVGTTPTFVLLEKNKDHMVTITKPGFEPQAIPIQRKPYPKSLAEGSLIRTYPTISRNFFEPPHDETQDNEKTGKGYQLVPQAVSIKLIPSDATTDGT